MAAQIQTLRQPGLAPVSLYLLDHDWRAGPCLLIFGLCRPFPVCLAIPTDPVLLLSLHHRFILALPGRFPDKSPTWSHAPVSDSLPPDACSTRRLSPPFSVPLICPVWLFRNEPPFFWLFSTADRLFCQENSLPAKRKSAPIPFSASCHNC